MVSVLQVLFKNTHHSLIKRYDQRLSILGNVHVHHVVIEVKVFDFDVHETSLSDTGSKKEVRHYPALILDEVALLNVRLLQ